MTSNRNSDDLAQHDLPVGNSAHGPGPWGAIQQETSLPFAFGADEEMVSWNPRNAGTLLLYGAAGSGKTGAADAILSSAALQDYELHVFDWLKRQEFGWLEPYTRQFADELPSINVGLQNLVGELFARLDLMTAHGAFHLSSLPVAVKPTEIIIHVLHPELGLELQGAHDGPDAADDQLRRDSATALETLTRFGRAAGMYLLIETNSPSYDNPAGKIINNALVHSSVLLLRPFSRDMFDSVFGSTDALPESSAKAHRGRGVFRHSPETPTMEVQCWWAGYPQSTDSVDAHVQEMVERISAHRQPEPDRLRNADLMP